MYTYLLLNIFTIIVPALCSFEKRVYFFKKWKHVFLSSLIAGSLFIAWDHYFTKIGVWGFNPRYVIGIYFFHLPVEEVLFFFCIPFSCLFIYELVCFFEEKDLFKNVLRPGVSVISLSLLTVGVLNSDKIYTSVTFIALGIFLLVHLYLIRSAYLGKFFEGYVISIIPFLVVNGILTNGLRWIHGGPVVWYNNCENLSVRIIGIPVEDFMYSMLLLLTNVTLYEYFKKK